MRSPELLRADKEVTLQLLSWYEDDICKAVWSIQMCIKRACTLRLRAYVDHQAYTIHYVAFLSHSLEFEDVPRKW